MFLTSDLVVLMVIAYNLDNMDVDLTMLIFAVYTLLCPHVATINLNNDLLCT